MMSTQPTDRKTSVTSLTFGKCLTYVSEENVKSLTGINFFVYIIIRTNTTVLIDHEYQK